GRVRDPRAGRVPAGRVGARTRGGHGMSLSGDGPTLRDAAWWAPGRVPAPELDRPITDLGFVASLTVGDGTVRAELRLPTYFCAPNFAWLMVADARDALEGVPGAGRVEVVLLEHFVSAEINEGVAAVSDFAATFT